MVCRIRNCWSANQSCGPENRGHEMWKTGPWMKKFGIMDHWLKGPVLCAVFSAALAGIGLLLR